MLRFIVRSTWIVCLWGILGEILLVVDSESSLWETLITVILGATAMNIYFSLEDK